MTVAIDNGLDLLKSGARLGDRDLELYQDLP